MKNKEIEEILRYLKSKDEYIEEMGIAYKRIFINNGDLDLLLTYIEQLENNRDKAIKYINEMSGYDVEDYIRQDLLLILKR